MEDDLVRGPRAHRNNEKMITHGDVVWQTAHRNGLLGIKVRHESNNRLIVPGTGHEFMQLCSCSYLGLNRHPKIIQGAIDALTEVGTTSLSLAEIRVRLTVLGQLEDELREQFRSPVLP